MAATATPVECERFSLKQGDVLFTKDSETPDEMGISSYVAEDMPNVLCGYHLGLARPANGTVNGAFLARALASEASAREFARIANGVTRFGLTLDATRSLTILFPSLAEQRAIAAVPGLHRRGHRVHRCGNHRHRTPARRPAARAAHLRRPRLAHPMEGCAGHWDDTSGLDVVRLGDVAEVERGKFAHRPRNEPRFYGGDIPFIQTGMWFGQTE